MILWIILVVLIYLGGFGFIFFVLNKKHARVDGLLRKNLEVIQAELKTKKEVLEEIARLTLGMIENSEFEVLGKELEQAQESIRAEKGRLTITEAELEAVDTRLRELEELKRELEVSNMDVVKEVEMLRAQERDIAAKNDAIKNQLSNSMEQLEMLLDMLQHSAEAVERLNKAKTELMEMEKKCSFYEEQIATINNKYMGLKRAYDALDIEYAQLYEKQQAAENS